MNKPMLREPPSRVLRRAGVLTPVHWWLTLAGVAMTLLAIAFAAMPR